LLTAWQVHTLGSIFAVAKSNLLVMSEDQNKMQEEEILNNENLESTEAQKEEVEVVEEIKEPTIEELLAESNQKFIRLYAEFENYRKRTNKEKVDLLSNASEGLLKEMIPVMDDFERAILNNENVEDAEALKQGFSLIYNKFKATLENKGLKAMESKGTAFDSELHEAIANIPASSKKEKGKVIDDVEKGYYLNSKVIRFAKVVVGQ
jgi:molecular chaperone GrpE